MFDAIDSGVRIRGLESQLALMGKGLKKAHCICSCFLHGIADVPCCDTMRCKGRLFNSVSAEGIFTYICALSDHPW